MLHSHLLEWVILSVVEYQRLRILKSLSVCDLKDGRVANRYILTDFLYVSSIFVKVKKNYLV